MPAWLRLQAKAPPEAPALEFADGRRRAWLHEAGVVEREEAGEDGLVLHLRWTARQKAGFEALDQPTD